MVKTPMQPTIPHLANGDKLTRYEFERRYNAMSHPKKAELIEGIVYIMPAALRFRSHGQPHAWILTWLGTYEAATVGLALGVEPTVRLDLDNEPQPDAVLIITPEAGGQARLTDDDYIEGAPELVVEIAASSVAIDLHAKKIISSTLQQLPHTAEAHNLLAYYHIYRGDWAKGIEVLQQFAEEHPNHYSGWYYYGCSLFQIGEYQTAAEAMFKAYRLYPKDCEIYRSLCEILPMTSPLPLSSQNRGVNLALIVEEMLKEFPDRWSIWATAGRVLVECFKEFERGCSVSQQGTKLQPQLADAWFRHGRVLALAGKHQEAVEALTQGWELLPVGGYLQLVPAAVWLGESYHVLGDVEASQRCWEAACEGSQKLRAFNSAVADYWLGLALVGLGDRLGAIQAYQSALSQQLLYPVRGEVEKSLKELKARRRKGYGG